MVKQTPAQIIRARARSPPPLPRGLQTQTRQQRNIQTSQAKPTQTNQQTLSNREQQLRQIQQATGLDREKANIVLEIQETEANLEKTSDPRERSNLRQNIAFLRRDLKKRAQVGIEDLPQLSTKGITTKIKRETGTIVELQAGTQKQNVRVLPQGGFSTPSTQISGGEGFGVSRPTPASFSPKDTQKIIDTQKNIIIVKPASQVSTTATPKQIQESREILETKPGLAGEAQKISRFFGEQARKQREKPQTRREKIKRLSEDIIVPSQLKEAGLSAAEGFFSGFPVILDPFGTARDIEQTGRFLFKTQKGTNQIIAEPEAVKKLSNQFSTSFNTGLRETPFSFTGGIIGGLAFDAYILAKVIDFGLRPVKSVVSELRLKLRGAISGTVKGEPGISFIQTREGQRFLLVENIHNPSKIIPGIGDIPFQELKRQAKVGTGQKITTGTFARGPLARGKPGDTFLIRTIEEHYGGVRSGGLFTSPGLTLKRDIQIITSSGRELTIKSGESLGVAAKEFASSLATKGTGQAERLNFVFRRDPNTLLVGREAIASPPKGRNAVELSKKFFDDLFSGVFAPAPQTALGVSRERELLAQGQREFPYPAKGTMTEFFGENIDVPIFTREQLKLPFGFETPPLLQDLYDISGFGKNFKDIRIQNIRLKKPPGQPVSLPKFSERPRVSAIIKEPFSEKILFVREGNQPFLFPGGGVDPTSVFSEIGKEKIKIGFPTDFRPDLRREVFEETGLVLKKISKEPLSVGIRTEPKPLRPLIKRGGRSEPAFIFQDVASIYEASPVLFFPRPRGEINEIRLFTPEQALARKDIGTIERQFLESSLKKPLSGLSALQKETSASSITAKPLKVVSSDSIRNSIRQVSIPEEATKFSGGRFLRLKREKEVNLERLRPRIVDYPLIQNRERKRFEIMRRDFEFKRDNRFIGRETFRYPELIPREPTEPPRRTIENPRVLIGSRRVPEITRRTLRRPPSIPDPPKEPRFSPAPFPTTRRIRFSNQRDKKRSRGIGRAFEVLTVKKGKVVGTGIIGTISDLPGLAKQYVNETLRASVGIKPTKGFARERGIIGPQIKLKPSKSRPGFFVEPRELRLSRKTEVREIQQERKRRTLFSKKNRKRIKLL